MQYLGKIVGVVFALITGSGFWGIVVSLLIGHMIDKSSFQKSNLFTNQHDRQSLFFSTTFEVMGHLTKSKGRVTETDIHVANQLMDQMNLHGEARVAAQNSFRFGKSNYYPLRNKIRQFREACFGRFDLIQIFLEIQIQAALSDGALHPNEKLVLYIISEELEISRSQFDQFLRMMQGGAQFNGNYQRNQKADNNLNQSNHIPTLEDACNVLGVKKTDDISTIKKAYRKLMSEHHPDKLVAKGLPSEMMEIAKEKTQKIQKAYELIKEIKGFK